MFFRSKIKIQRFIGGVRILVYKHIDGLHLTSWRPCWRYRTKEHVISSIVGSSQRGRLTLFAISREINCKTRIANQNRSTYCPDLYQRRIIRVDELGQGKDGSSDNSFACKREQADGSSVKTNYVHSSSACSRMVVNILHYGRGLIKAKFDTIKKQCRQNHHLFFKLLDDQAVFLNLAKVIVLKDFISPREYLRFVDSV